MSLRLAKLVVLSATLLGGPPAHSANPDEDFDPIVVTGKRISQDEAQSLAQGYVRGIAVMPFGGQYARWKAPVCPRVLGLSAENAASVVQKIRDVAREAGAPVGGARCSANLDVLFTEDGIGRIRAIAAKSRTMLAQTSAAERKELLEGSRPVRWWYFTRVEGMDGHKIGAESAALASAQISGGGEAGSAPTGGPGFISDGDTQSMDGYNPSLIGTRVRSNIESVWVVVDVDDATGKPLDAVGAYVAMTALAQIRMDRATPIDGSILNLFEKGMPSTTDLSGPDRAFLFALYHTPPNRDRKQQANAMIAGITKLLGPK